MKSFLTRLTSGVVLVLLIGWTCWRGSLPLGFFVTVIGGIGLDEFYKVFGESMGEERQELFVLIMFSEESKILLLV